MDDLMKHRIIAEYLKGPRLPVRKSLAMRVGESMVEPLPEMPAIVWDPPPDGCVAVEAEWGEEVDDAVIGLALWYPAFGGGVVFMEAEWD